ncbi:MAG: hypothetical protein HY688_02740 [Chloroflexi bacterium]|nr:hypothetical protein [Chloroflexota bacterium]
MTSVLFLKLLLPALMIPALAALVLPSEMARSYVSTIEPAALIGTAALSWWVAFLYREGLRRVFLFVAGFLVVYGITNVGPLMDAMAQALPRQFPGIVLALQLANYSMLLLACVQILRVVQIRRLDRAGWLIMVPVSFGALYIVGAAFFPALSSLEGLLTGRWAGWGDAFQESFLDEIGTLSLPVITYILVRTFDAAVLLMLVPVLLLYIQNTHAEHQESLTFSVVVFGIIASLTFVYAYELVSRSPLFVIAQRDFRTGSFLDALYIFGYLTIAVGLYAHRKHQQWSLSALERMLR